MSENTLLLCTIAETWIRRLEKNDAKSKSLMQSQSQFLDLTENKQTRECVSCGEEDTEVILLEYQLILLNKLRVKQNNAEKCTHAVSFCQLSICTLLLVGHL